MVTATTSKGLSSTTTSILRDGDVRVLDAFALSIVVPFKSVQRHYVATPYWQMPGGARELVLRLDGHLHAFVEKHDGVRYTDPLVTETSDLTPINPPRVVAVHVKHGAFNVERLWLVDERLNRPILAIGRELAWNLNGL